MSDALKAHMPDAHKVENLVAETGDALHLKSTAAMNAARKTFRGKLSAVRGALADAPYAVRDKYENVSESMDDYVHDKPWQAVAVGVGLGVGIGIGLGILTAYLAERR